MSWRLSEIACARSASEVISIASNISLDILSLSPPRTSGLLTDPGDHGRALPYERDPRGTPTAGYPRIDSPRKLRRRLRVAPAGPVAAAASPRLHEGRVKYFTRARPTRVVQGLCPRGYRVSPVGPAARLSVVVPVESVEHGAQDTAPAVSVAPAVSSRRRPSHHRRRLLLLLPPAPSPPVRSAATAASTSPAALPQRRLSPALVETHGHQRRHVFTLARALVLPAPPPAAGALRRTNSTGAGEPRRVTSTPGLFREPTAGWGLEV